MSFQNSLLFLIENLLLLISIIYPGTIPKDFLHIFEEINNPKPEVIGEQVEAGEVFVVRVIDGDTIELETGEKVRYIGIDSPEISKGRECFAEESKNYNKLLVEGKKLILEKDISETDRYGRLLRYVYNEQGMINLKLVADGYALASSFPPDIKYQELLKSAEEDARINNRGLWGSCLLKSDIIP